MLQNRGKVGAPEVFFHPAKGSRTGSRGVIAQCPAGENSPPPPWFKSSRLFRSCVRRCCGIVAGLLAPLIGSVPISYNLPQHSSALDFHHRSHSGHCRHGGRIRGHAFAGARLPGHASGLRFRAGDACRLDFEHDGRHHSRFREGGAGNAMCFCDSLVVQFRM
jgi:hypothetical protein